MQKTAMLRADKDLIVPIETGVSEMSFMSLREEIEKSKPVCVSIESGVCSKRHTCLCAALMLAGCSHCTNSDCNTLPGQ